MSRKTEQKGPSLYDLLSESMELDQKILQYLRHSDERRNEVFALMLKKNTRLQNPRALSAVEQLDDHLEDFFRSRFPNIAGTNNLTGESRYVPKESRLSTSSSNARPLRGNTYIADKLPVPDVPKIPSYVKKTLHPYAYTPDNRTITESPKGSLTIREWMLSLISTLLTDKLERKVDLNEKMVEDTFDQLIGLAESVESKLVTAYARKKHISRLRALQTPWSIIYQSLRDRSSIILEKKALEELDLNIGRCDRMWAATELLKHVCNNRLNREGLQGVLSLQQHENMTGEKVDKKPRLVYGNFSKSSAPPLVIPANHEDSSDESNNDSGEVTRKRPLLEQASTSSQKCVANADLTPSNKKAKTRGPNAE